MTSDLVDPDEWMRPALLAILDDFTGPADARVRAVVHVLDRAKGEHGVASQALARAVVAVGVPLLAREPLPQIERTIAAAKDFVRAPSDAHASAFFAAATASYPFGPGDGCLSMSPRDGCKAGSGCHTGAGTLLCVAETVGADVVIAALADELAPWLRAS